jgi:hypothetical protein
VLGGNATKSRRDQCQDHGKYIRQHGTSLGLKRKEHPKLDMALQTGSPYKSEGFPKGTLQNISKSLLSTTEISKGVRKQGFGPK